MNIMRKIDSIIIHCSATKVGQDFTAADIDRWHRERGFNGIGYHYVVCLDGRLERGRDISLAGAHCKGWNEHSIGICYIGGLDVNGHPADTRTKAQKRVLYQLIMDLQKEYGILQVFGHRDTSPDLNGDGVIEANEYVKVCPCFDVKEFLKSGREALFVWLVALMIPFLCLGCRGKKEIVCKSREIKVDSSSTVGRRNSLLQQAFISRSDSEVVEEHLEQIVFIYPVDTASQVSVKIVKNSLDRRTGKLQQVVAGSMSAEEDSLSLESGVEFRTSEEVKKTVSVKRVNRWKRGIFILGGIALIYGGCRWMRRFKV